MISTRWMDVRCPQLVHLFSRPYSTKTREEFWKRVGNLTGHHCEGESQPRSISLSLFFPPSAFLSFSFLRDARRVWLLFYSKVFLTLCGIKIPKKEKEKVNAESLSPLQREREISSWWWWGLFAYRRSRIGGGERARFNLTGS